MRKVFRYEITTCVMVGQLIEDGEPVSLKDQLLKCEIYHIFEEEHLPK